MIDAIRAVLDRNRATDTCDCQRCTEAIKRSSSGKPCSECGYNGPLVAAACACYDYTCPGGDNRGAGCFHGALFCPACDGMEVDAWEIIREIRAVLNAQEHPATLPVQGNHAPHSQGSDAGGGAEGV